MPNKENKFSGIYKYNQELIKIKTKSCKIKTLHSGNNERYFHTFVFKFFLIPFYLIINSHKFYTLILPEEGYAFLRFFSFSKKNIIIIHDYRKIFSKNHNINLKEKIKQFYLDINFIFIKKFFKIIVPSNFTKELISKNLFINLKKISVIPNIINFKNKKSKYNSKFKVLKNLRKGTKIVLSITSNETRKNLKQLNDIVKNCKKINFIIIGNLTDEFNLNNVFNFKNISDENLIYLFKKSNAYLDVSLFEGFGRSLVEAQIFKLRVICFKTKINKEILKNSATYIKSNSKIPNICETLKKNNLTRNKNKYYKNARRFSLSNVYKNFSKNINEI